MLACASSLCPSFACDSGARHRPNLEWALQLKRTHEGCEFPTGASFSSKATVHMGLHQGHRVKVEVDSNIVLKSGHVGPDFVSAKVERSSVFVTPDSPDLARALEYGPGRLCVELRETGQRCDKDSQEMPPELARLLLLLCLTTYGKPGTWRPTHVQFQDARGAIWSLWRIPKGSGRSFEIWARAATPNPSSWEAHGNASIEYLPDGAMRVKEDIRGAPVDGTTQREGFTVFRQVTVKGGDPG